ncbi:MAG: DUF4292 domain-containing protein [Brumimicrobium sp.]|nr:DUF4292 domain-containing protein [Brumimicrobium sp.]
MRHVIIRKISFVLCVLVLVSCGSRKGEAEEAKKLPKIKEAVLISRLDSLSKMRPEHFYTKLDSKYTDKDYNISFKTSIRMRRDSALHALITYARIPIYNTMVTPDTLTIVDKRNDCYIKENMSYLKNTFDVDFQHSNIEELILGMPIGWDSDEDYYQIKDPYNYIVSSHNKRKLRKSDKDLSGDVYIKYYLGKNAKELRKVIIESPVDTTTIEVNYFTRETVEGFSVPLSGSITIQTPRDTIMIGIDYNKTTVNDPRVLYLAIPNKYERCE